jgi:peroxiredoxin
MKDNFLESDSLSKVVFGINRIQSGPTVAHVKRIHTLYDQFITAGADQVCCVSFNDVPFFTLLMPKYSDKIKFIQDHDSLIEYQRLLGKRGHPEFLKQYWQFACIIKNNIVQYYIEQEFNGKLGVDTNENIYGSVAPERVLQVLRNGSSVG